MFVLESFVLISSHTEQLNVINVSRVIALRGNILNGMCIVFENVIFTLSITISPAKT